jgi:transposase InsO family protein
VKAMGIRDRPISPGSPWQNGCAERLIGTLRCECFVRAKQSAVLRTSQG